MALISYGRQFHIASAPQRKAYDQIFVQGEHGSSCLSLTEYLSIRRKILLVIRDPRYVGSPDSKEFVSQSGD